MQSLAAAPPDTALPPCLQPPAGPTVTTPHPSWGEPAAYGHKDFPLYWTCQPTSPHQTHPGHSMAPGSAGAPTEHSMGCGAHQTLAYLPNPLFVPFFLQDIL